MTDEPVEWMEEAIENDLVDTDTAEARDYFDNWDSFAESTQSELNDLFETAREAENLSEEEADEGYGPEEPGKSGTY